MAGGYMLGGRHHKETGTEAWSKNAGQEVWGTGDTGQRAGVRPLTACCLPPLTACPTASSGYMSLRQPSTNLILYIENYNNFIIFPCTESNIWGVVLNS